MGTSNGVDESHDNIPAPDAPSFIALDKRTGKLVWADNSPGKNILHGQWSSPAVAVLGGVPQAIFAGGDGWVYSFLAKPTASGKPELLWKFDGNPKESVWEGNGQGDRANIIVDAGGLGRPRVRRHGPRPRVRRGGRPSSGASTRRSAATSARRSVFDKQGRAGPAATHAGRRPGRGRRGEGRTRTRAAIWEYTGHDANGDGEMAFEERMHRALGMVAVKDGLLVVADLAGLVHCLDAKTGRVHWTHDMMATVWGSPLVVDGKIYLGDEDGDVAVFELSAKMNLLAENNMGDSVYSAAGGGRQHPVHLDPNPAVRHRRRRSRRRTVTGHCPRKRHERPRIARTMRAMRALSD